MILKPWVKLAAPVVLGLGLGLGLPALTAVGQSSPPSSAITLGNTATLVAKGVSASVPVVITCPAGSQAQVSVGLSERAGKSILQAFSDSSAICTGSAQSLVLAVAAPGRPWKAGTALGQANLFVFCFSGNCSASDSHTVKLVNK